MNYFKSINYRIPTSKNCSLKGLLTFLITFIFKLKQEFYKCLFYIKIFILLKEPTYYIFYMIYIFYGTYKAYYMLLFFVYCTRNHRMQRYVIISVSPQFRSKAATRRDRAKRYSQHRHAINCIKTLTKVFISIQQSNRLQKVTTYTRNTLFTDLFIALLRLRMFYSCKNVLNYRFL